MTFVKHEGLDRWPKGKVNLTNIFGGMTYANSRKRLTKHIHQTGLEATIAQSYKKVGQFLRGIEFLHYFCSMNNKNE